MPTRNKTIDNYNPLAFLSPLRLLGVFIIVTLHHTVVPSFEDTYVPLYTFFRKNGGIIVGLFFLISGMMFYLVYYKRIKNSQLSCSSFFWKRLIKLWPLIAFSVVFMYITYYILINKSDVTLVERYGVDDFFRSIFMLDLSCFEWSGSKLSTLKSINQPMWYVTVLLICYGIACFITRMTKNKKHSFYYFAIPIIAGISLYIMWHFQVILPYSERLFRGFIYFFLGIFVMMFLEKFKSFNDKTKIIIRASCGAFVLAFVLMQICTNWFEPLRWDQLDLIVCIALLPAFFIVCYDVKWLNKLLSHKFFMMMAPISFSMYVFDNPIRFAMQDWGKDFGGIYILIVAIIILAVGITLTFAEKYIRKFINLKIQEHKQKIKKA